MKSLAALLIIFAFGFTATAETMMFPASAMSAQDRRKMEVQDGIQRFLEAELNKPYANPQIQVAVKVRWRIDTPQAVHTVNLGNLDVDAASVAHTSSEPHALIDSVAAVDISVIFPSWFNDEAIQNYQAQIPNFIPLVLKAKVTVSGIRNPERPKTYMDQLSDPRLIKFGVFGAMFFLLILVITLLYFDTPAPTRVIVQMPEKQPAASPSKELAPYIGNVVRMAPGETYDDKQGD